MHLKDEAGNSSKQSHDTASSGALDTKGSVGRAALAASSGKLVGLHADELAAIRRAGGLEAVSLVEDNRDDPDALDGLVVYGVVVSIVSVRPVKAGDKSNVVAPEHRITAGRLGQILREDL